MITRLSFLREIDTGGASADTAVCTAPTEDRDVFNPYRNLALEKYLTFHAAEGECVLYLWQNKRTVVIGKNQNAWRECDVQALKADGGFLVRRLSGGGAVYHDLGNLNYTFCARRTDYDPGKQMRVILEAVHKLGIDAELTGRNDVTYRGRKFSGNAYYQSGEHCCHHGTLMLKVDFSEMQKYLRVSEAKLQAKGVDSVRSRVMNLSDCREDLTTALVSQKLREAFGEIYQLPVEDEELSSLDWEEIHRDQERFASWDWCFGRRLPFTHQMEGRFRWGGIELLLKVDAGIIRDCLCYSDAMEPELADSLLIALKGCRYEREEILSALDAMEQTDPCGTSLSRELIQDIRSLAEKEMQH